MSYEILVVLHILVIGYWLGTDLAVYYISGAIVDPQKSTPVRVYAARTMLLLDMVPRTALILTLLTGMALAARMWLPETPFGWWWLWPLLLGWLALTWAVFGLEHGQLGQRLARIDFGFRIIVIIACAVLAAAQWMNGHWLALKLALFALIVALGLVIRIQLRPFGALFAKVAQGQADAVTQRRLEQLIARVKVPVWMIWIGVVAAAVLGRVKPGF